MKQAKTYTETQLKEGYEIVPMTKPTCQPNQNARLYGQFIDLEDDEPLKEKTYED